jgi:hypothetical protein
MTLVLAPQFTQISFTWTNWKTFYNSKGGVYQYYDDGIITTVYFYDPPEVYYAIMWDASTPVPPGVIAAGYSQAQNNADLSDFQTNWQAGANKRISRTDSFGNPVTTAINFAASFGLLPNATSGRAQGYVGTSATSGKAIRATTYTPQGANAQRSVNSNSTSDISAGTGAQKVTINYLDTGFISHSETITLNGTTAVNTVGTNIAFIENMAVAQVGTGGGNAGTIQIFTTTAGGGSVWGSVAAGDNQTFWAHHYVPSGVTCYITAMNGSAMATVGQVNMNHSGNPLTAGIPQQQIGPTLVHLAGGAEDHYFQTLLPIPGPDLVWLNTKPFAVTADTSFGFFTYLQF